MFASYRHALLPREVFALGVLLVEVLVQAQGAWRTHMERAKALDCLNVAKSAPACSYYSVSRYCSFTFAMLAV